MPSESIDNNANDNPSFIIGNTGITTATLASGTVNTLSAGGVHTGLENGTSQLIIEGKGSLIAAGHAVNGTGGAGIGGSNGNPGRNIKITGENVIAKSEHGAGIGGGMGCNNKSDALISGGNVTAIGSFSDQSGALGNTYISFGDSSKWYQWRSKNEASAFTTEAFINSYKIPYKYAETNRAVQFTAAVMYEVKVTAGSNMTRDSSSGAET